VGERNTKFEKMYSEKLQELCCSPNILMVNKSRRMRWAGNVARREYNRNVYNFDWEV